MLRAFFAQTWDSTDLSNLGFADNVQEMASLSYFVNLLNLISSETRASHFLRQWLAAPEILRKKAAQVTFEQGTRTWGTGPDAGNLGKSCNAPGIILVGD